ncbi:hypothetical protein QCA50_000457 [Cerrena zonata]|uniref:Chromosome partition protein Smc n=1 Tax=Cerrena zonata TaxID=2478898 RepID=A0AAW0GUW7_9APHY
MSGDSIVTMLNIFGSRPAKPDLKPEPEPEPVEPPKREPSNFIQYAAISGALAALVIATLALRKHRQTSLLPQKFEELNTTNRALQRNIKAVLAEASYAREENAKVLGLLEDTRKELKDMRQELEGTRKELKDARKDLDDVRKDSRKDLETTRKELENTRKELQATQKELKDTRKELQETRKELKDTRKELDDAKKELDKMKITAEEQIVARDERMKEFIQALLQDKRKFREQQWSAQEMSEVLATIAAFMQEVEIELGLPIGKKEDGRGYERIRRYAQGFHKVLMDSERKTEVTEERKEGTKDTTPLPNQATGDTNDTR